MAARNSPIDNDVLAALRPHECERLAPILERVGLRAGQILFESGAPVSHIYFPGSAIVSLLCGTHGDKSCAVALTGREGIVAAFLCLDEEVPDTRAVVDTPGTCWRAPAGGIKAECARAGTLQALAVRCTIRTMVQMARTAVCNRHHKLEQQLCRWILMTLDRSIGDSLQVTHEHIAGLLGVRREGVSTAAHKLASAGLIVGYRGRIRVIDRAGLEQRACECYFSDQDERAPSLIAARA